MLKASTEIFDVFSVLVDSELLFMIGTNFQVLGIFTTCRIVSPIFEIAGVGTLKFDSCETSQGIETVDTITLTSVQMSSIK